MATINTIEDLVQVLDDNPKWLEAIRARVLTRELLELPQTVARLTERVDQLTERVDQLTERVDRLTERMDQLVERMDQFVERMDQFAERMDQFERRMDRMTDDLGVLKGAHTRSAAIREAAIIANDMGLRLSRTLSVGDMLDIEYNADTSGIPANQLRSFRLADLVMEARDGDGEACYAAVEVSFTVNGRDTSRAIRNADFLSRFTGRRSYAAVAGLHRDDRVRDAIESGEVFWYQMDPQVLEAG